MKRTPTDTVLRRKVSELLDRLTADGAGTKTAAPAAAGTPTPPTSGLTVQALVDQQVDHQRRRAGDVFVLADPAKFRCGRMALVTEEQPARDPSAFRTSAGLPPAWTLNTPEAERQAGLKRVEQFLSEERARRHGQQAS